jgi:hypothetical protein
MRRPAVLLIALILGTAIALLPLRAGAQHPAESPWWAGEVAVIGANGLLGGLTAGTAGWLRGESFADGFARGFGGGTLVYAGKRIAADDWTGAGMVGRQVASVGSSVVGNVAAGRRSFDRVALSVGPIRIYTGREVAGWGAWRIDAPAVAAGVWGVLNPGLAFDADESLSSGMIVFRSDDHSMEFPGSDRRTSGLALPGTIFHTHHTADPDRSRRTLSHERVHVLQYDQAYLSWSDGVERWIAGRSPGAAVLHRYLEFNLVGIGGALLGGALLDCYDRPWEVEAYHLSGGW